MFLSVYWLARLLSFKRPFFVSRREYENYTCCVCLFVRNYMMLNISESHLGVWELYRKVHKARRLVTSSMTSRDSITS